MAFQAGRVNMATVQQWNSEEFEKAVSQGVVLADFYAVWCGPCKMMMSILEKAVSAFDENQLKVGKINIDECRELAAQYKIRTIPTFIIFKDGQVVDVLIGVQSQNMLVNAIRNALD